MELSCGRCKSDNIQRLSSVYEGGISSINTKTKSSGIGIARGGIGLGLGRAKTKGTSQSAASLRAAPPPTRGYLKPLALIFVGWFILLLMTQSQVMRSLITVGSFAGAAAWVYFAFQYNANVWPPLKAIWDDSYLCNRCNEVTHVSAA
jgi:hypothetical protein